MTNSSKMTDWNAFIEKKLPMVKKEESKKRILEILESDSYKTLIKKMGDPKNEGLTFELVESDDLKKIQDSKQNDDLIISIAQNQLLEELYEYLTDRE